MRKDVAARGEAVAGAFKACTIYDTLSFLHDYAPCSIDQDYHNLPMCQRQSKYTMEMHNSFVENVVATERVPLKAISVAGSLLQSQPCIMMVYDKLCTLGWEGVDCPDRSFHIRTKGSHRVMVR